MKSLFKLIALLFGCAGISSAVVSAQSISVNESLAISIKGVPLSEQGRISGSYNVDGSGYVHMPMLKKIKASGRTISSLARSIEAAYEEAGIYTDPRIAVASGQDDNKRIIREKEVVSIGGYVKSGGPRPYVVGMTLFQAVSAAGGETPFGSIRRVELHRKGRVKIYDMRKSENMRIKVLPGDSIKVPKKKWNGT